MADKQNAIRISKADAAEIVRLRTIAAEKEKKKILCNVLRIDAFITCVLLQMRDSFMISGVLGLFFSFGSAFKKEAPS